MTHDYYGVFDDFKKELSSIPENVRLAAYAFRDFCTEYIGGKYEKEIEMKAVAIKGEKSYDKYEAVYLITVKSDYTQSMFGHIERSGTISITIKHPFIVIGDRNFIKYLAWDPVQEVCNKLDKMKK